mgnify:CR=1 FL=1
MFKAAVIGCGFIAGAREELAGRAIYSHGKAYRKNAAFKELGFVDVNPGRAKALARKFGGKPYRDVAALLEALRPDVVSVCVPDDRHFDVLRQLLESPTPPKAVFAEKPVCATREQLDALFRLERTSGARIIVNHTRRFDTAHRRLKSVIRDRELGEFLRGHVDYYGGFRHLGVHVVDLLQFLFDETLEPMDLRYCCDSKYPDDPTLDGRLMLGKAPINLAGIPERHYQILDIDLLFTRGQIKISDFGQRIEVLRKTVNEARENVLEPDHTLSGHGMQNPIVDAVALIAAFLKSGKRALIEEVGLDEARKTMETLWRGSERYADHP